MSRVICCGLAVILTDVLPVEARAFGLLNPFDTCGACGPRTCFEFGLGWPGLFGSPCCGVGGCGPFSNSCCAPPSPCDCGPGVLAPNPLQWNSAIMPSITTPVTPPMTPSVPVPVPLETGPVLPPTTWNCAPVPVCTTAVQPRQVTTYRTVPTIQYRQEAYIENVPVTTYQQVLVPRTVYQPQTRYRNVAYTVNQTVAETRTHYVPQPMVSYLPPTPTVTAAPVASNLCAPCMGSPTFGPTPEFVIPSYPTSIATAPVIPYTGTTLGTTLGSVPLPIELPESAPTSSSPAATLQPPQYSVDGEGGWQTIPRRQASGNSSVEPMGGLLPSYAPPVRPISYSSGSAPRSGLFQPAPSAATVWQSRWLR